jgi:multidrug transporter EmrE-like cation transporter
MFGILITITVLFEASASVILRLWAEQGKTWMLIVGILGFAIAALTFGLSLQYKGLAVANMLWIAITSVLLTGFGYFVFKENLTTVQLCGILVVMVGALMLSK